MEDTSELSEKQFLPKFNNYMKKTYQIWNMLPDELQQDTMKVIYQVIQKDFGDLLQGVLDVGFSPNMTFDVDEFSEEFVMDLANPPAHTRTLSALKVAVKNNSSSCIKILVSAGAHICPSESILFSAYKNADFDTLALLLEHGADPDERNQMGTPLLCVCARNHDNDVIELLLTHGASVHAADIATLRTPLHYSVTGNQDGCYECTRLLLEHGANPNSRNRHNESPAFVAAAFHTKSMELILSRGGKINMVNTSNSTALHHVFVTGEVESARHLINILPDLNTVDATGHTVLDLAFKHYAIRRRAKDAAHPRCNPTDNIKMLINHNAKTHRFSTLDMIMLATMNPHKIELIGLIFNSTSNCNFITNLVMAVSDHVKDKYIMDDVGDDDRYLEFYDRFYRAAHRPRSLKHLCRCTIRTHIGKRFANVAPSLQIPKSVISYLLLDDPCDLK